MIEVIPDFIDGSVVTCLAERLERCTEICEKIRTKNNITNSENTSHHLIAISGAFFPVINSYQKIDDILEEYFGGKYILNSFGGNKLIKGSAYSSKVHRDIRSYQYDHLVLNTLIALDDFTEDNGAIWLLDDRQEKPDDEEFFAQAKQMIMPAGSLLMFNSNIWHCAGENRTDKPRRSLTPMFSKPFIKPQFNYTQFVEGFGSEYLKQLLGYYSQVPQTLEEWYQPPDKRKYRSDQG